MRATLGICMSVGLLCSLGLLVAFFCKDLQAGAILFSTGMLINALEQIFSKK